MKNLSLILNVILIIAVGVLYYLHFNSSKPEAEAAAVDPASIQLPSGIRDQSVLYVNADSLNANYEFVKTLQKEAQTKQASLENRYETKAQKFQQEYMSYQEKLQAGTVNMDQAKAIEESLQKQKNELDMMQEQVQNLIAESQKKNLQVQKEVFAFLKEFSRNKNISYVLTYSENVPGLIYANDSLDITKEVVAGLNSRYNNPKK